MRLPENKYRYVDWREVAARWDGISITPYQWSCRHELDRAMWYNGWDCASACVWNLNAIEEAT